MKNEKQEFKNRTKYIRGKNDGNGSYYTKVSNQLINDNELDFLQVGLMTYLLSHSDSFVVSKKTIFKSSGFGKVVFDRAWKGLVDNGYLEVVRFQGGVEWVIREEP